MICDFKHIKGNDFMLKYLSPVLILAAIPYGAQANIYPDQIVHDSLGEDVCRFGYRPIDRYEAAANRSYLVDKMGAWQITGLKDNWVIMGSGYNGEIKQDHPNSATWCHPTSDQTSIPNYAPKSIAEGTEVAIQHALINDHSKFIRPLSYLAHYLGYAWVSGNRSNYVGEDMKVRRTSGDKWTIQGDNSGSCSGYRCDEKTKITVDNFAYTLNDGDFWHGTVVESERELINTVMVTAINNTNIPQQVVVNLSVDESTNWSKTNSYGFSQKVETENTFKWPLVGSTKISISIEANQNFSNTNGGSSSQTVALQARPMVPANSSIPIKVQLYRSTISYPYRFGADISYDVNFNGFLRWGGNAWNTHPDNRPYKSHTFTLGRSSPPANDIRYQWNHRYIPSEVRWWDWSWAISNNGLSNMHYATAASLRPFNSYVSGDFNAESQFAGNIEIGEPGLVGGIPSDSSTGVDFISNFDADGLEALGFSNAKLTMRMAN